MKELCCNVYVIETKFMLCFYRINSLLLGIACLCGICNFVCETKTNNK